MRTATAPGCLEDKTKEEEQRVIALVGVVLLVLFLLLVIREQRLGRLRPRPPRGAEQAAKGRVPHDDQPLQAPDSDFKIRPVRAERRRQRDVDPGGAAAGADLRVYQIIRPPYRICNIRIITS